MASFRLTREAIDDVDAIWLHIYPINPEAADAIEEEVRSACRLLAERPLQGHRRRDLTRRPVLWVLPKYPNYVIVYDPEARPLASKIVGAGGSLHGKGRADARSHSIPVARTEMADYAQLRTVSSQHVGAEARLRAESGGSPVLENVISRAWRSRQLRRENPYYCIRTLGEIRGARDNHGRTDLGFLGTDQNADHQIARPQSRSSDSSVSRRRRDAALNSFRSSSDHESDQSIL